jgi:hypothetical protein
VSQPPEIPGAVVGVQAPAAPGGLQAVRLSRRSFLLLAAAPALPGCAAWNRLLGRGDATDRGEGAPPVGAVVSEGCAELVNPAWGLLAFPESTHGLLALYQLG